MKLYKVLNEGKSCSGGKFDWTDYLPTGDQPGQWTPVVDDPGMCKRGYHGTDALHVIDFLDGNQLWEVEALMPQWGTGENENKFVAPSMRLIRQVDAYNDTTLRLFACWCVRQVWHLLTDERSRNAVELAERYANGDASQEEMVDASAAAGAAASAAAGAAAWAAARAAAWDAAWDATRDAARAARDAARAARDATPWAARDAARDAQSKHLAEMLGIVEEE